MRKLSNTLKAVLATSFCWLVGLSSCGSLMIKTWYTDPTNVDVNCQNEKPFIRRDNEGKITEALTILQANSYRCYSQEDDTAWRDRLNVMVQCCNSKDSNTSN